MNAANGFGFSARLKSVNMLRAAAMKYIPERLTKGYQAHRRFSAPILSGLMKASHSAEVCFQNYYIDWQKAMESEAIGLQQSRHVNKTGQPIPVYCYGGLMYLPEGEAKARLNKVKDELFALLPKVFFRTPDQLAHITAFILHSYTVTPDPGYTKHYIKNIGDLCNGIDAPRFTIIGINITRDGVIYAKCYPHDDSFQKIRNIEHGLFPSSVPKDIFNITLGRAYRPLSGKEWKDTIEIVRKYFKDLYIGEVQPLALSLGNFEGSGILHPDVAVKEVKFNPRPDLISREFQVSAEMSADYYFLDQAIELAAKGDPEKACKVGALVVKDGVVLGSAYKYKMGMLHSDVLAIMEAIKYICKKDKNVMAVAGNLLEKKYFEYREEMDEAIELRKNIWRTIQDVKQKTGMDIFTGATLYVNLEPCNSHGRWVGCAEVIANSGIRKVVFAATDPGLSARYRKGKEGDGLEYLKQRGVEIIQLRELTKKAIMIDAKWFAGDKT